MYYIDANGDVVDDGDPTPPPADVSVFNGQAGYNYFQSPPVVNSAADSWTGTATIPQTIRDGLAVINTGLGLSLAKDQFTASRDIARANLAAQVAQANGNVAITRAQAALAANQAAMQARYPNGLPLGMTRSDQIMILIGVAGLLFAYMQTTKK